VITEHNMIFVGLHFRLYKPIFFSQWNDAAGCSSRRQCCCRCCSSHRRHCCHLSLSPRNQQKTLWWFKYVEFA